jgi:hypothetical protein
MCFGTGFNEAGQLGTVYLDVEAVASCGTPKCLPVSLASYISFSDDSIPVVDVQAGFDHTCGNPPCLDFEMKTRRIQLIRPLNDLIS